VRTNGVELAWLPPLLEVRAAEAGARVVAVGERGGALVFRSALLVRADSPHRTLSDLVGARAAWNDRASASGYLFPRLHLASAGFNLARDLASESFLGSPSSAMAAVADGRADLCACFVRSASADPSRALDDVQREFPAARWRLRVLAVTDVIPPDGMVVPASVDKETATKLRAALLGLHETPAGASALQALLGADRLVKPTEEVALLLSEVRHKRAP
jgi:ABC-type phosphate/phosphonate transport system substrate-binding protein